MRVNSNIHLDPNPPGGGGGGNPSHAFDLNILPDDLKAEPSLATIKTIPDLAKGFVHAQRMIGTKRVAVPEAGWSPEQLNEFYGQIGRPADPDKYTMPEGLKLPEGVAIDEVALKEIRKQFHGMGLTDRQFKGIMQTYLESVGKRVEGETSAKTVASQKAMESLKTEWAADFDNNVAIAKSVIGKFAESDPELMPYLEASGLGNNVPLVKLLNRVGKAMLEDTQRGGEGGGGLHVTDAAKAQQEIARLNGDPEFMKALNDPRHPMHGDSVKRRLALFQVAYPGKSD